MAKTLQLTIDSEHELVLWECDGERLGMMGPGATWTYTLEHESGRSKKIEVRVLEQDEA